MATLFGWANIIAVSQAEVQSTQSEYLENSASVITAAYFSSAGTPFTPAAVSYRIDDIVSGINVVPWTVIAQPANTNRVLVSSTENFMISLTRPREVHQILFQIIDGYGDVNLRSASYELVRAVGEVQPGFAMATGSPGETGDGCVAIGVTIVVGPPALKFNLKANSQYVALISVGAV